MAALTLTIIGPDRPGLVRLLSDRIAAAGGNWLESRMAQLAGQFAGILLAEAPADRVESLAAALRELEGQEGLRVTVAHSEAAEAAAGGQASGYRSLQLDLIGQDHPGIVRDIAEALAARGVNIEELTTDVRTGSFSGEAMFQANARLQVPAGLGTDELAGLLETLANELMVDVSLEPPQQG